MGKNLFIIFILLFLVACDDGENNQNDDPLAGAAVRETAVIAPTPTLVPGLPTETPQPAVSTSEDFIPTITSTPTPTVTPTPTPEPVERFPLGQHYFYEENFAAAAHEFQIALAAGVLDGPQTQEALLKMGQSFYYLGQYQAATDTFSQLLAQLSLNPTPTATQTPTAEPTVEITAELTVEPTVAPPIQVADPTLVGGKPGETQPPDAYYWLALSYQSLGDCPAAIGAFGTYLSLNSDMAAYLQPSIADCYLTVGDRTAAYAALEAASEGEAPRLVRLNIHRRLADMYLEDKNYQAAISEYEAILSFAITEGTRGQTHYLIGTTALTAGNTDAANENFLIAVNEYPKAYESYLSLIALVEAGIEVDPFQRGLVDYYAEVYDPAVTAFNSYIEANPIHREDVYLYLAWSYEAMGNVTAALSEMDAYIESTEPPPTSADEVSTAGDFTAVALGILEKGKLQARAGLLSEAVATYQLYLERFPAGADAPYAAWWSAEYTERLNNIPGAIALYQAMAASYPNHQDADEALFHAGYLYRVQGQTEEAIAAWKQTAETFPNQEYGAASLLWLLKTLPPEEAEEYRQQAAALNGDNYFILRADQQALDIAPFSPSNGLNLDFDTSAEQEATEEWLRSWLQLGPEVKLDELPAAILTDPEFIRGVKLWRLGLREEARRELDSVWQHNRGDGLLAYQFAIFFRDLGLYRHSISAAGEVMSLAQVSSFDAPVFLARLAYPVYYADLITAESQKYGYDPLLQFALIRQESLYESFATSSAVAQGLSQVIPDTGAYIANQLNWPDYENADLYRPYVGIAFGAFYLNQQLAAFDGFVPAALSAYNAGPGNAARWYNQVSDDLDRYHEIVNFAETRLYIERIYIGHVIYRHLYGE